MLGYYSNKNIAILGFGREGKDTLDFLRKVFPKKQIFIADRLDFSSFDKKTKELLNQDKNLRFFFGKDYLSVLDVADVIIKSPGIPFKIIKPLLARNQELTSQTKIFFENCPGTIIGITGTKGKSTTSSLIYHLLTNNKVKAKLIGNIGKPVLSILLTAKKSDIFVYELSSHQLANLTKSPHIAVFLNVYPEHLDYYNTFGEYVKAKTNIFEHQTANDYLVFNKDDKVVRGLAELAKGKKIPFSDKITVKDNPLRGKFNLYNINASFKVGEIFGLKTEAMAKALKTFKPLPHRLEFVGKYKGIEFYNDSLATVPEATISAIEAFEGSVKTLITGGFDRGQDFKELAKAIVKNKISTLILFPDTGIRIFNEVRKIDKRTSANFVDNMESAVELSFKQTPKKSICLLSCASASFNLFKDYQERGDLFKRHVKKRG